VCFSNNEYIQRLLNMICERKNEGLISVFNALYGRFSERIKDLLLDKLVTVLKERLNEQNALDKKVYLELLKNLCHNHSIYLTPIITDLYYLIR